MNSTSQFNSPYKRLIRPLWEQYYGLGPGTWTPRALDWMSSLQRPHLLVFAAHACWLDAWSAGFYSFYCLSTGIFGPEAAEGFRVLGLPRSAAVIAEANRYFGKEYPRDSQERRQRLPAQRPGEPWNPFSDHDEQFLETLANEQAAEGDFEDLADAFVLRHCA